MTAAGFLTTVLLCTAAAIAETCSLRDGDVSALNFALSLEHLEAAFYNQGLSAFTTSSAFTSAGFPSTTRAYLSLIAQHENAHVDALTATLVGSNCTAVAPCTYTFNAPGGALSSVANFVATAVALEAVGVSAYDGAINTIQDAGLRQTAATIATVEARHSAALLELTRAVPFALPFDVPRSPNETLAIAAAFIGSCPPGNNIPLPKPVTCKYGNVVNSVVPQPAYYSTCQLIDGDVKALNYALTLENLETAFYNQMLTKFSKADFLALGFNVSMYNYLQLVRGHETAHAVTLTQFLTGMGCAANPPCVYNFNAGLASAAAALATANTLENLGVSAYVGAVNAITDSDIRTMAATIATVEARHAAILGVYSDGSAPNASFSGGGAFDQPTSPATVVGAAAPFISSCTYSPTANLPLVVSLLNCSIAPGALTPTCSLDGDDLAALNYALTLERLEAAFYVAALTQFTEASFLSAGYTSAQYALVGAIRDHELAHVTALVGIISGFGCDPVPACAYNFTGGIASVATLLQTAQVLENLGVTAYNGAIDTIRDPTLREIAATIATVEARHAAFLLELTGFSPFPSAVDTANTPLAVIQQATMATAAVFISSCPYPITLPTPVRCLFGDLTPTGYNFTGNGTNTPASNGNGCRLFDSDLTTLNFALTLENLENQFYIHGLQRFDNNAFINSGLFPNATTAVSVRSYLITIGAHESAHVQTLTNSIAAAGCSAAPVCTYNFNSSLGTVTQFLATAFALESTGVGAYDGAINTIRDEGYRKLAAQVATVEARHAAVLGRLVGDQPWASAFDTALDYQEVLSAAGPFIVACPYTIPQPKVQQLDCKPTPAATCTLASGDVAALNYALTLENLEASFYSQALAKFSPADFASAGFGPAVYSYVATVAAHEAAHVSVLTDVLRQNMCSAVPACTYDFTNALGSVAAMLSTASTLESTGVSAYDGAINTIRDAGLRQVAATIATVEARHATVLREIVGEAAIPTPALDTATSPTDILAVVSGFITSCPYTIVLPQPVVCRFNDTVPGLTRGRYSSFPGCGLFDSDLAVLNYALSLEYLEARFYTEAVAALSSGGVFAGAVNSSILAQLTLVGAHETAHVNALTSTIQAYNCTAIAACTYNFTNALQSPASLVSNAASLESTGVSAYDGAVNGIRDPALRQTAATIATIEARHAAYLNALSLNGETPVPFDTPKTPTAVIGIASAFVASCPASVDLNALAGSVQAVVLNCVEAFPNRATTSTGTTGFASTATTSTATTSPGGEISVGTRTFPALSASATALVMLVILATFLIGL